MKSKFENHQLSGVSAKIINSGIPTYGKHCIIQLFDSRVNKYKVEIASALGAWVAWYTPEELKIDELVEKS